MRKISSFICFSDQCIVTRSYLFLHKFWFFSTIYYFGNWAFIGVRFSSQRLSVVIVLFSSSIALYVHTKYIFNNYFRIHLVINEHGVVKIVKVIHHSQPYKMIIIPCILLNRDIHFG